MFVRLTDKNCPVCLDESSFKFIRDHCSMEGTFSLYECLKCGVQFWVPFKNPGSQWYESQGQYRLTTPHIYRGYHKKFLELYSVFPPGTKVLEFGCGTGELLYELQIRGAEVYGVDLSKINIQIARQYFGLKNLYGMSFEEFFQQSDLPQFDLVVFFETIEHLDKPLVFIQNVKRILKPGGRIVLSTPSRERILADSYKWDYPLWHLSRWNQVSISRLFQKIDFEIVSLHYTDQYIHFMELCYMYAEKIVKIARLQGRLGSLVQHFFNITRKYPAMILWLIGKLTGRKNGVMVIELEQRGKKDDKDTGR